MDEKWHVVVRTMERAQNKPGFPKQPQWFEDARGFKNLEKGSSKIGFSETETNGISK